MESEEDKKKQLNDDVVVFLKTDPPRYNARLHAFVDLQRKRSRAEAARRRSEHLIRDGRVNSNSNNKKTTDKNESNNNNNANREAIDKAKDEDRRNKGPKDEGFLKRWRSGSPSKSVPSDRCGRRRRSRRRRCRRRRRRSCRRRRRRRRRSCRRRRRRSRRRSCSRRRRRRSCRRRRRRSRRRRRC